MSVAVKPFDLDGGRTLRFEPAKGPLPAGKDPAWHAIGFVEARDRKTAARFGVNLRAIAYVPGSMLLALVAAVPVADARKRLRAGAIGAALLALLVGASVTLAILSQLSNLGVASLGNASASLVHAAFEAIVVPPGMAYTLPGLIWLLAAWLAGVRLPAMRARAL